jgi:SAM-dependent methyltransferase
VRSHDVFNSAGAYEPYVGRWSRRLAPAFIEWLDVADGSRWLDVGCGTGALTDAIIATARPASVAGIDPSAEFIDFAAESVRDSRASFSLGNAMALDFPDAAFDVAVSALVLNFVPDPRAAAREMRRVARPGGCVGACVWDYSHGMRMMRVFWDAAVHLNASAAQLDEGARFPICQPAALRECLEAAGLRDVESRALDVDMAFTDFDDYWSPFLGGQAPAPAYAMSLGEEDRAALRELIRSRLPVEPDGSIHLTSRAWAVRGTVPA